MARFLAAALALMAPVEASRAAEVRRILASRSIAAAGVPDPHCASGVVSAKVEGEPQACCAGYCGEYSDYPTCKSVREQDSEGACCKTKVLELACGGGAAANICLKKCTEAVPPCIMDEEMVYTAPDPDTRTANSDCDKAVEDWRERAKMSVESAEKA